MIYRLLDRLAERYSEREHKLEAMRAREEYFDRAGKVFDDDAELFEGRMASFLEWYVLERPFAGGGPTPVACATRGGCGAAGRRAPRRWPRWPTSHHSLFELFETSDEVLDIEDLIGGARFSVRERRKPLGMTAGDLFEARLVWDGETVGVREDLPVSSRPTRARSCSSGSSAPWRAGVAREEILFHLSRQHIRWHRHGHVGAAKVYRDA